jgi:antitoxin (DNA-binding transcriptional repressor) of toxin-antitoxin stability system
VRLTDQGRQVARLLTANGEPPEYLPELEKIREETPDRFPNWPGRDEVR